MEAIEIIIFNTLNEIVRECDSPLMELKKEQSLHQDLGLSSLQLARLIAMLEQRLEFDPFAEKLGITSIKTINDLILAYQTPVSEHTSNQASEIALFQQEMLQRRNLTCKKDPAQER